MRLAVYTDSRYSAGAEVSLATLLEHLTPEIDVTVIGVEHAVVDWLASHRPAAQRCVIHPVARKRDLRPIAEHMYAIARLRPQILHANLNLASSCRGAIVAGLLTPGVRVVGVEHTLIGVASPRERRRKTRLLRRVDAHIAVGERLARELERTYRVAPGSIGTIHTGVADRVAPVPAKRDGPPQIGYVGRLAKEKGLDVLLRALARLPHARLVLVGDGPLRGDLEQQAATLGLADRVTFSGWQAAARAYLPGFDVVVLPSMSEAFGLSAVEAMLACRPVVASDVGSVCEAVLHEQTGLLVAPGDADALAAALRRVLADPALAARLGRRGREVALERFAPATMARAFEALYEELLMRR